MLRPHAWKLGAGALCAASGLALQSWSGTSDCARCHAAGQSALADDGVAAASASTVAAKSAADLAALSDWLRQQGADIDAIEFKQSEKDDGRYGVYANEKAQQRAARGWWGTVAGWAGFGRNANITLAGFPLTGTLTAANLAQHPQQGPLLMELMQMGVADERTAVILHLAVERQQLRQRGSGGGASGPLAWLALLPSSFSSTLYFSELDMQWLRGTTLYKATRIRQKSLRDSWMRLEPAARRLAERSGLAAAPTFDDWLWANSIFWSRAIAFPSPAPDGSDGMVMQEGIVPGLDFCNHDAASPCKWTVYGAAEAAAPQQRKGQQQQPTAVSLICPRRQLPAPGGEVTINYGDKSNEELLFLYGFAVPRNSGEVLTLLCPLPPPAEWDELLQARLLLLRHLGLGPQLHLPAADLARLQGSSMAGGGKQQTTSSKHGSSSGSSSGKVLAEALPEGVVEALEVFLMEPKQVQQELEAAEAAAADGGGGSAAAAAASTTGSSGGAAGGGGSGSGSEMERAGVRMGLLTTLVRLLEVKTLEMEGQEEGTGLLEQDEQLLAAAGEALPRNQRHALLYRIGQKQLARAYLIHAKQLLQQEMGNLARLQTSA